MTSEGQAHLRSVRRRVPRSRLYRGLSQLRRVPGHAGPDHRHQQLLQALCHDRLAAGLVHGGCGGHGPHPGVPPVLRHLRPLLRPVGLRHRSWDRHLRRGGDLPQAPGLRLSAPHRYGPHRGEAGGRLLHVRGHPEVRHGTPTPSAPGCSRRAWWGSSPASTSAPRALPA